VVGVIQNVVTALAAAPHLRVTDETTIEIRHALLALPGATLGTLTNVMSHPVALAQCGRFLARHPRWTVHESYDTAGAARDVAAQGVRDQAAIASVRAAERYQLAVVAEDIQDVSENRTRFVVIGRVRRDG
jgi:prephenate dehydratase